MSFIGFNIDFRITDSRIEQTAQGIYKGTAETPNSHTLRNKETFSLGIDK